MWVQLIGKDYGANYSWICLALLRKSGAAIFFVDIGVTDC